MKLIVGLGNLGRSYTNTRHNIGFMVVDALVKDLGLDWRVNHTLKAEIAKNDEIIVIKPLTFMNNSGLAVKLALRKFGIAAQDTLVVMDDLDMEFGKIRFRAEGSSGGHRGLESIINHLQTTNIPRLKVGIGRGVEQAPDQYVLAKLTGEQTKIIKTALPEIISTINQKFIID